MSSFVVLTVVDAYGATFVLTPETHARASEAAFRSQAARESNPDRKAALLSAADEVISRWRAQRAQFPDAISTSYAMRPYTYGERLAAVRAATTQGPSPTVDMAEVELSLLSVVTELPREHLLGLPTQVYQVLAAEMMRRSEPSEEALFLAAPTGIEAGGPAQNADHLDGCGPTHVGALPDGSVASGPPEPAE